MPTATFETILTTVQTDVRSLDLVNVQDRNIVVVKLPTDQRQTIPALPCVMISPFGAPAIEPGGVMGKDDISYPVAIITVAAGNQSADDAPTRQRHLLWHERIRKQFVNQRLSTVAYTCRVDPRDTFDNAAYFGNYDAGGFIMRFLVRENRTP